MSATLNQEILIVEVDPLDTELHTLLTESDSDLLQRYSSDHIYTISLTEAQASGAVFLIARRHGVAVGCGAFLPVADRSAEIKRMFVRAEARRCGIARCLLAQLESSALQRGCETIRLETGNRQPESIALYESAGYRPIPCFGEYAGDPHSLCYEKRLVGDRRDSPS